jgi:hypothetical protein
MTGANRNTMKKRPRDLPVGGYIRGRGKARAT